MTLVVQKNGPNGAEVEEEDYAFLGEIETEPSEYFWSVEVTLNDSSVRFKIDTGADVTVIPERIYKMLQPPPSFT